jgi:hypothetical protein
VLASAMDDSFTKRLYLGELIAKRAGIVQQNGVSSLLLTLPKSRVIADSYQQQAKQNAESGSSEHLRF